MRNVWIIVLSTWLVWAGCGASNAQQAKKAQPAKPAEAQSDSDGPSLQETLEFLRNSIRDGAMVDRTESCQNEYGNFVPNSTHFRASLQTDQFPLVQITVVQDTADQKNQTATYSIDLRRVDPQQVRVGRMAGNHLTCTPPQIIDFYVSFEGTNKQSVLTSDSSQPGSQSQIYIPFINSEDAANRLASAMRRAVQLAGGKPSAF
jgi:hypothetical protein